MSRVVFCSDIHYQYDKVGLAALIDSIAAKNPDLVILGGDLADCSNGYKTVLLAFRSEVHKVACLAGNHDLWSMYWRAYAQDSKHGYDTLNCSYHIYDEFIPEICEDLGVTYLEKDNIVLGNWGIVGSLAWYDYSYKHASFNLMPDEYFYLQKKNFNNDGNFLNLSYNDVEFSKLIQDRFNQNIEKLHNDPEIKNIFVMTHVPVFEEAIGDQSNKNKSWLMGSSYFYNLTFGKNLTSDKIKGVISGHTHYGVQQDIVTPAGNPVRHLTSYSDYGSPTYFIIDLDDSGTIKDELVRTTFRR